MKKNYSKELNDKISMDNGINESTENVKTTDSSISDNKKNDESIIREDDSDKAPYVESNSLINRLINKIIYNDKILLILSVILGVFAWAYVTHKEYPDSEEIIKGVNIDFNASISGTEAEREGYKIYDCEISKVDINVKANRTKLAFLNKDDFYATVSVDNYIGEQPVPATIQIYKSNQNDVNCTYELCGVSKTSVYMHKEITKNIEIEVVAPNISAPSGYKIKSIICDSVSVTGPDPLINSIDKCVLNLDMNTSYDERKSMSVDATLEKLTFYDADGNILNTKMQTYLLDDNFKINKDEVAVIISVSKIKDLDITYSIVDLPSHVDEDFIRERIILEPTSISVSSDDPSLDEIDTLPVISAENISLNDIDIDFNTAFNIEEALKSYTKLTNDSKNIECFATFNSDGLTTKTFDVLSNFNFKNPYSSKYKVEAVTQCLTNVKVIGPKNTIEKLKADDLILEVDIAKSDISTSGQPKTGQNTYSVSIIPKDQKKFRNIWVVGKYEAEVQVIQNEDAEVTSVAPVTITEN